jgi:hypothetical protein
MIKGQVIGGELGKVFIRQKSDVSIEMGELMVSSAGDLNILLQVYDLLYGSQISQANLELISGMRLEEGTDIEFLDPKLRNYSQANSSYRQWQCQVMQEPAELLLRGAHGQERRPGFHRHP